MYFIRYMIFKQITKNSNRNIMRLIFFTALHIFQYILHFSVISNFKCKCVFKGKVFFRCKQQAKLCILSKMAVSFHLLWHWVQC